jgi:hypothetical protein
MCDKEENLYEASDNDLIWELEERNYIVKSEDEYESDMVDAKEEEKIKMDVFTKTDYKRFLCDIINKGYQTDNQEIIDDIKKLIE